MKHVALILLISILCWHFFDEGYRAGKMRGYLELLHEQAEARRSDERLQAARDRERRRLECIEAPESGSDCAR